MQFETSETNMVASGESEVGSRSTSEQQAFFRNGYCVFENILEPSTVDELTTLTDAVLEEQDPDHFAQHITTGSMVLIDWDMAYTYEAMARFIAHPNALTAMRQLGYDDPKFGHGRIITKPPHSPPLFWHEDGRFWDDPVSYTTQPIQVFLMYYLTDTTPENGCLRVVPESHLKRHRLHDEISPRHTEELRTYENPDDPGFSRVDDEVDVPIKAGDLVVGYGSLLHASHGNQTDERRTVLTMWYYPDFVDLPERTRATVASMETRTSSVSAPTSEKTLALMEPLRISYDGDAEPIVSNWVPHGLK